MSVAVIGVVAPGPVSKLLLCPSATNGPSQLTNPRTRPAVIQNLNPESPNFNLDLDRKTRHHLPEVRRDTKYVEGRPRLKDSPHPPPPVPYQRPWPNLPAAAAFDVELQSLFSR